MSSSQFLGRNFTSLPPLPGADCFSGFDNSNLIQFFNKHAEDLYSQGSPFQIKVQVVGYIAIAFSLFFIFRQVALTDSRSEKIRKFLRSKGVLNDNSGDIVLQPLATISYNLFLFVARLAFFFTLLFPAAISPSLYPRDLFNVASNPNIPGYNFPRMCAFEPHWSTTSISCVVSRMTRLGAEGYAGSDSFSTRSIEQTVCDTVGHQFFLPDSVYTQGYGLDFLLNITAACVNETRNSPNTGNCTIPNMFNASTVGTLLQASAHESPLYGAGVLIGLFGTLFQVLIEYYYMRLRPEEEHLRKLRTISTSLLNYYDFVNHMGNSKTAVYKEFDWRFTLAGVILQGFSTFTPLIFLFASYTTAIMISFYPIIILLAFSSWDLIWLLFILVARRTDQGDPEDMVFTDFDRQLEALSYNEELFVINNTKNNTAVEKEEVRNEDNKNNNNIKPSAMTDSNNDEKEKEEQEESGTLEDEIKKMEEQQDEGKNINKTNEKLNSSSSITTDKNNNDNTATIIKRPELPKTLEDLLPTLRSRSWMQIHQTILLQAFSVVWSLALIKWVPLDAISPLVGMILSLPFFLVALFWTTRNSLKLSANDDGTLTCFLEKISGSGISVEIDITTALLRNGCRIEVIKPENHPHFYEKNKIDPKEFLAAKLFVDHLDYLLLFDPDKHSESSIQQKMQWLKTIVATSHRDLFTAEITADIPRKQPADASLAHLVTFAGRACQSEELLELALRLDANNKLASTSLHFMKELKQDPNSLPFDGKLGERFRICLRAIFWFLLLFVNIALITNVLEHHGHGARRVGTGSGVYSCIDKKTFPDCEFCRQGDPQSCNPEFYEACIKYPSMVQYNEELQPIILSIFPQMIYVQTFVFWLLFIVHMDIFYKKRITLDSTLLLRLQGAGGILCAMVWPSVFSMTLNLTNELVYLLTHTMVDEAGNSNRNGHDFAWVITMLSVRGYQVLGVLIGPVLGIVFPLIP